MLSIHTASVMWISWLSKIFWLYKCLEDFVAVKTKRLSQLFLWVNSKTSHQLKKLINLQRKEQKISSPKKSSLCQPFEYWKRAPWV